MPFFFFCLLTFCTWFDSGRSQRSLFKIPATKPDVIATLAEWKCSLIFNYSGVIKSPIKLHLHLDYYLDVILKLRAESPKCTHGSSRVSPVSVLWSRCVCVCVSAVTLCSLCWLWCLRSVSWPHARLASPGWPEEMCVPRTPSTRTSLSSLNRSHIHCPWVLKTQIQVIGYFHFMNHNYIFIQH